MVLRYDARSGSGSGPLFTLDAHSDAVSVVAHNPKVPGLVLTASHDKTVKLWNVVNNKPAALATKKLDLVTMHPCSFNVVTNCLRFQGAVFCASFYGDSPFVIAAGGEVRCTANCHTFTEQLCVYDSRGN